MTFVWFSCCSFDLIFNFQCYAQFCLHHSNATPLLLDFFELLLLAVIWVEYWWIMAIYIYLLINVCVCVEHLLLPLSPLFLNRNLICFIACNACILIIPIYNIVIDLLSWFERLTTLPVEFDKRYSVLLTLWALYTTIHLLHPKNWWNFSHYNQDVSVIVQLKR